MQSGLTQQLHEERPKYAGEAPLEKKSLLFCYLGNEKSPLSNLPLFTQYSTSTHQMGNSYSPPIFF